MLFRLAKRAVLALLEPMGKRSEICRKTANKLRYEGWKAVLRKAKEKMVGIFRAEALLDDEVILGVPPALPAEKKETIDVAKYFQKLQQKEYRVEGSADPCVSAAFTIVSKNYMQYALTLRESFLGVNPAFDFYIILVDMIRNDQELAAFDELLKKGVKILGIHEIRNGIADFDLEAMLLKYTILEMNTAIKPFFLEYFCCLGYRNVFYFDPDIMFFQSLHDWEERLESFDVILTPHALKPYPEEAQPNDLDIMRAGTFNLGFIAIRNTENALNLCHWWQRKLFDQCVVQLEKGLFVDQKWIDFVPSFFDKVYIERSPAYNVAYWNLHERSIEKREQVWLSGGEKMVFFHFSGMPISDIECISKYQTTYTLDDFPQLRELFGTYRDAVMENGYALFRAIGGEYYFGYLPGTNIRIPDFIRYEWRKEILEKIPNPYAAGRETAEKMLDILCEEEQGLPRILRLLYRRRRDLQEVFPGAEQDPQMQKRLKRWIAEKVQARELADAIFFDKRVESELYYQQTPVGVNLVGYFEQVLGTSMVARNFMERMRATAIPYAVISKALGGMEKISEAESQQFSRYAVEKPFFDTNLFFMNADNLPNIYKQDPSLFAGRYNIACWWWEFEDYFDFPEAFSCVNEVIVMSEFIRKAVAKVLPSSVKLTKMNYPFLYDWEIVWDRKQVFQRLGLKEDEFVFFFNFDFMSSFERKNPLGLLAAFEKFAAGKEKVKLVLKAVHGSLDEKAQYLRHYIKAHGLEEQVRLIEEAFTRNEFMSVLAAMDGYISLHRSEGLGLGLMEAMALGKPVIATAYGGNLDFMTEENSLLVPYSLIELKQSFGPYKEGWFWAEPDVDAAAQCMERVFEDYPAALEMGSRAQKMVREKYSMQQFQWDVFSLLRH